MEEETNTQRSEEICPEPQGTGLCPSVLDWGMFSLRPLQSCFLTALCPSTGLVVKASSDSSVWTSHCFFHQGFLHSPQTFIPSCPWFIPLPPETRSPCDPLSLIHAAGHYPGHPLPCKTTVAMKLPVNAALICYIFALPVLTLRWGPH